MQATRTMQVVSSITMIPPVPSMVLRSRRNSLAMRTSSSPAGRIGMDMPPGITPLTLRPWGTPRACSKTISSSGVPSGSS